MFRDVIKKILKYKLTLSSKTGVFLFVCGETMFRSTLLSKAHGLHGDRVALVPEKSQLASLKVVSRVAAHSSTDGGGGCTRARRLKTPLRARVSAPL